MKKYSTIIAIALILVGVVWGAFTLSKNKQIIDKKATQTEVRISQIPVKVIRPVFVSKTQSLSLIGTFKARKELSIIAETQGRLTALNVNEGDRIRKGQVLASINATSNAAQLDAAKSSLIKAKKDLKRFSNLYAAGAMSKTQLEEATLAVQNQKTNVTALEQQLSYNSVIASMNGVVNVVNLEEGSFVNPGMQIAQIVDINTLDLILKVNEKDIVAIREGQTVDVNTEVYPTHTFTGTVSRIGLQADNARKYEVVVTIDNTGKFPLKPGMYASARIPFSNEGNERVLSIPRKSGVGSIKDPHVYVVRDGKAELVSIELEASQGDQWWIRSGLGEQDQVITTGQINLEAGREVKIINE